ARAGVKALVGAERLPAPQASNLVTTLALPDGLDAAKVLPLAPAGHALSAGVGPGGAAMIRLNHTGLRARPEVVLADLADLGAALNAAAGSLGRAAPRFETGQALAAAAAAVA